MLRKSIIRLKTVRGVSACIRATYIARVDQCGSQRLCIPAFVCVCLSAPRLSPFSSCVFWPYRPAVIRGPRAAEQEGDQEAAMFRRASN